MKIVVSLPAIRSLSISSHGTSERDAWSERAESRRFNQVAGRLGDFRSEGLTMARRDRLTREPNGEGNVTRWRWLLLTLAATTEVLWARRRGQPIDNRPDWS